MNLPGITQLLRLTVAESTQTAARALADQGAPDRTLVWADRQTAGRGRMSRKWQSAAGGLYVSLILRPRFAPSRLAELSLMTAQAAAETLSAYAGIETAVKAPNDVYAFKDGKGRKICGILTEASGNSRGLEWLIIGVGINVNNKPSPNTAVSLKTLTGKSWKPSVVLEQFIRKFNRRYADFLRPAGN